MFTSNRTKPASLLILLLSLTLLLAACGGNSNKGANQNSNEANVSPSPDASTEPASEKIVTDAAGNKVTIPANPQRIVASYLEDPVLTLGSTPVAQWTVNGGVQNYLQDKLAGVPTLDYDMPPEQVASFEPDLILVSSEATAQKGLYEQYSKIAPTYVVGDKVSNNWREALRTIGGLLGKSEQAEQAIKDYEQKAADSKAKLTEAIGTKSAAVFWLTGKNFYLVDEKVSSGAVLYGDLGMKPSNLVIEIPEESRGNWSPISLEKLAELDADYIFILNSDKSAGDTSIIDGPVWKNIPAVKAGNVIELDSNSSWLYKGKLANERIIDDVMKALVK
ncbi:iron-hydroxamate ABC transporter substrate-binding protein [Paenibacillus radicis (ex Gao et al. 2016)]|uniref:Ferrichrome ABC transporter substrate-binding protein n=1 Tax=Paenibacillus radicis (ex Gao et al. 2016) TaxID=1737354 RepID=A0A917M719_9BACL|nr:iron-hydroxamate ABC transporter substrate-binding protein [Paenibacillus radicis (ex Gao et al. 2016)]GGG81525.1 ferrichrome ABC transporter substrate-binding protein [Paenibacillus radicis (ex Gao et al. 2016)]